MAIRLDGRHLLTFTESAPLTSRYWRKTTCEEARCPDFLNGWWSRIDESTELGMGQAWYIRKESGRGFTEERDEAGLTLFRFRPGQRCFRSDSRDHLVPRLDKSPIYVARGGSPLTGFTGETIRHSGIGPWYDHLATAVDRAVENRKRG